MPQRFNLGIRAILTLLAVGGFLLGYLSFVPPRLGLEISLIVLNGVIVGIAVGLIFWSHNDLEEEIENLRIDMNEGVDRIVEAIEDDGEAIADGGDIISEGQLQVPYSRLRELQEVEDESPSGSGALGGLIAGGLLGAAFGPAGVIAGGVIGGLLGNEVEYQNLATEEREFLQELVKTAIQDGLRYPRDDIVDIDFQKGPSRSDDDSWQFDVSFTSGNRVRVYIYPDEGSYRIRDK